MTPPGLGTCPPKIGNWFFFLPRSLVFAVIYYDVFIPIQK